MLEISSATGVYPNLPEQVELTYEEVVNEEVVATGKNLSYNGKQSLKKKLIQQAQLKLQQQLSAYR